MVSHDRAFLDNVVTSILVFEADGTIAEYVGGYSDWLKRNRSLEVIDTPAPKQPQDEEVPASQAHSEPGADTAQTEPVPTITDNAANEPIKKQVEASDMAKSEGTPAKNSIEETPTRKSVEKN